MARRALDGAHTAEGSVGRRYATATSEPARVEAGSLPRRKRSAPRRGRNLGAKRHYAGAVRRVAATTAALVAVTASPAATAAEQPAVDLTDATAVSELALRATPEPRSVPLETVRNGDHVRLTGVHRGSFSEVTSGSGATGWVLTGYLDDAVGLPDADARRYVNAEGLDVVSPTTADPARKQKVADLPRHLMLQVAGDPEAGLTPIIWDGEIGWVPSNGLVDSYSDTFTDDAAAVKAKPVHKKAKAHKKKPKVPKNLGTKSLNRLEPEAKLAVVEARDEFPKVKSIGGWRPGGASYVGLASDHDDGRAIDIMVPHYNTKTGKQLGDQIAKWAIKHAKSLDVKYVIWRQRNYRPSRGHWVHMADRGGPTQNHFDHVHISFNH